MKNRLCYESELASIILENANFFFQPIQKVSTEIINLLTHSENSHFLSKNTIISDEILNQLYSNTHFGTIEKAVNYCTSQAEFLQKLIQAFSDEGNLPKIIHLHQVFMQFIFDKLPFKAQDTTLVALKEDLVKKIFVNTNLFKNARIKVNPTGGVLTKMVGIAGSIGCEKISTTELHQNAIGVFSPSLNSYWGKVIQSKQLPFVAGPSGHTGSSILLGVIVGRLSEEELKAYLTATMGVLVGGGYHTADEVMAVYNSTEISRLFYEPGDYHYLLSPEFLCLEPMVKLTERYPNLSPANNCKESMPAVVSADDKKDITGSIGHGAIRGISNVIEQVAIEKNVSLSTAHVLQQGIYYSGYFSMKLAEQCYSNKQDSMMAIYQAAIETGQLYMVNSLVDYVISLCKLSNSLKEKAGSLIGFGLFGLVVKDKGLIPSVENLVYNVAAQSVVERAGNYFLSSQ